MDRLLFELMGADRMLGCARRAFHPGMDVFYSKEQNAIIVKLELAGIDPDAVELEAQDRVLRVAGQRNDQGERDKVYQQMEIACGPFERRVALPVDVDVAGAQAHYRDGFLEIVLPVSPGREAKRIPVNIREQAVEGDGE